MTFKTMDQHLAERQFFHDIAARSGDTTHLVAFEEIAPAPTPRLCLNASSGNTRRVKGTAAMAPQYLTLDDVRDVLPIYVRCPGAWSVS